MRIAALVVGAVFVAAPVWAQASPEATLQAYFDAVLRRDWPAAARLLEIEYIVESRRGLVATARRPYPPPSIEDHLRRDSTMPRAVAEYFVAQAQRAGARLSSHFRYEFAGVRDTTELLALSDAELAARWVQARDPREALRAAYEDAPGCGHPDSVPARVLDSMVPRIRLVGAVQRGDTAWVIVREQGPAADEWEGPPRVAMLRRRGAGWRIDPRLLESGRGSFALVECPPPRDSAPPRSPGPPR